MRKLFVALLILSVMGGAFAQDEEAEVKGKGTWAFSGSASASTKLSLGAGVDGEGKGLVFKGENMRVGRDGSDFEIKATWDYVKGAWSIKMPFTINKRGVSTMGWDDDGNRKTWDGRNAYVQYKPEGSALTLQFPFAFVLDEEFDIFSMFSTRWFEQHQRHGNGIGIKATWEDPEKNYGFGASYDDIIRPMRGWLRNQADQDGQFGVTSTGSTTATPPTATVGSDGVEGAKDISYNPTNVWGWGKFIDGKLTVAAAYKGGYATTWWRASTLSLTGRIGFNFNDTRHKSIGYNWAEYGSEHGSRLGYEQPVEKRHFENIGEGGGLAIKFDVNESLNFGIVFRDGTDQGTTNGSLSNLFSVDQHNGRSFLEDFLYTPVFGVGYTTSTFKASAMFSLDNYQKNILKDGVLDKVQTAAMLHLTAGAIFTGVENLTVQGDITVYDIGYMNANEANFNMAIAAQYKVPNLGLTFDLKFAGTDLSYKDQIDKDGNAVKAEDSTQTAGSRVTPAAVPSHDNNASRLGMKGIGVEAIVTFNRDLSETMNLTAKAGLSFVNKNMHSDRYDPDKKIGSYVRMGIEPTVTWKVYPKATISLGYALGLSLDKKDPALFGGGQNLTNALTSAYASKTQNAVVYKNDIVAKFTYTY